MTALLIDTHIWLWYAQGASEHLPTASVKKLEAARTGDGLMVSAISVWEIGVLSAKGRIHLSVSLRDWVNGALDISGIVFAALDAAAAVESTLLPGNPHGDPADRLLIATARTRNIPLATRDRAILDYGKAGFLRTVAL